MPQLGDALGVQLYGQGGDKWWVGNGYGISNITDVSGRPLLTYQGFDDKAPILLADRVAQKFNFTQKQQLIAGAATNARMDSAVASAAKKALGGGSNDELDHKISLELGGANTPANLFVQPGINGGASAASDTLENNLALDVVAGRISLLDAWRTLEEQKGFLIAEDIVGTQKQNVGSLMSQLAGNLKDYISGKVKVGTGKPPVDLKVKMDQLLAALAKDPLNQNLKNQMFSTQIDSVSQQLNVTKPQAAGVVKSYLSAYAQSKGLDPKEMWASTNLFGQQIIDNSKKNPELFGVPSEVLVHIIGVIQAASIGLVTAGLILAVIGIMVAGPEVIVGALGGGLLESIGAIFGVSLLTGLGLTSFAVGEALNVAAIGLNMSVKSMYDNRYLLPTQEIDALKNILAIQKGLSGFLPSASPAANAGTGATKTTKKAASVVTIYKIKAPNGKTYIFKSATALNAFKVAAGLQ